jgi:hypothetical protein
MFKQDHMERIEVYFEHFIKLANNLQTKLINKFFTIMFNLKAN